MRSKFKSACELCDSNRLRTASDLRVIEKSVSTLNFVIFFENSVKHTPFKMSQAAVVNYLNEQKRTGDKDLAAEWGVMEELYNEK